MNKKTSPKAIIIGLVVLALIAFFIWQSQQGQGPTSQTPSSNATTTETSSSQPSAGLPAPSSPAKTSPAGSKSQSNVFTSPASSNGTTLIWTLNTPHVVSWTKSVGVTGSAYLLKASDLSIAGCILQTVQQNQTSFNWDTQYLYANCQSPTKTNVTPGSYIIRIQFAGSQGSIQSSPFGIIYPTQTQQQSYSVTIKNFIFDQTALTVVQGDKITITNDDTITHNILVSGVNLSNVLAPGQSIVFDTSILTPGYSYNLYSNTYSSLKLAITVKAAQY